MSQAYVLSFTDKHGSRLEAPMSSIKKWTNINGVGNHDLAPGEIATHSEAINGQVRFVGTFLSTIPFARKYGVLQSPLELWIENSTICSVASDVPGLAGRSPSYITRQLYDFQHGTRGGPAADPMKPEVAKLTDDSRLAIAAYLASLKP